MFLESWNEYVGYNCNGQHGATNIIHPKQDGTGSLDTCKSECSNHPECSGIVYRKDGFCYLRKNIQLISCQSGTSTFNVYIPTGNLFAHLMMLYDLL